MIASGPVFVVLRLRCNMPCLFRVFPSGPPPPGPGRACGTQSDCRPGRVVHIKGPIRYGRDRRVEGEVEQKKRQRGAGAGSGAGAYTAGECKRRRAGHRQDVESLWQETGVVRKKSPDALQRRAQGHEEGDQIVQLLCSPLSPSPRRYLWRMRQERTTNDSVSLASPRHVDRNKT
eukprot:763574-Hanusia_phi.AAC.1